MRQVIRTLLLSCVVLPSAVASRGLAEAADGPVLLTASLAHAKVQEDFPAICLDRTAAPWVVYVEYDGKYYDAASGKLTPRPTPRRRLT